VIEIPIWLAVLGGVSLTSWLVSIGYLVSVALWWVDEAEV
jgi:hypothetical protein